MASKRFKKLIEKNKDLTAESIEKLLSEVKFLVFSGNFLNRLEAIIL